MPAPYTQLQLSGTPGQRFSFTAKTVVIIDPVDGWTAQPRSHTWTAGSRSHTWQGQPRAHTWSGTDRNNEGLS